MKNLTLLSFILNLSSTLIANDNICHSPSSLTMNFYSDSSCQTYAYSYSLSGAQQQQIKNGECRRIGGYYVIDECLSDRRRQRIYSEPGCTGPQIDTYENPWGECVKGYYQNEYVILSKSGNLSEENGAPSFGKSLIFFQIQIVVSSLIIYILL